jgi:uncharacterized iron-regulated membrane protein
VSPPIVMIPGASRGGSSSAGILLLLVAIIGLVALFTGNLDRWIDRIAGKQGGAAGLVAPPGQAATVPEVASPTAGPTSSSGGAQAAAAARAAGFQRT